MLSVRRALGVAGSIAALACGQAPEPRTGTSAIPEPPEPSRTAQASPRPAPPAPEGSAAQADSAEPAPEAAAQGTQIRNTKEPDPVPELPKGTTILHVGDSFAGALGIDLNRQLKAAGIKGVLKYQTSSYIPTWASGKELGVHLARTQPDLVLITLGANELEVKDPETHRARAIERLVSRLDGRPCVWIAPPLWEGAKGELLEVIRAHCAPCVYLDSTALVPDLPRARDRIHPSMEARKTWAVAVLDWLARRRDLAADRPWELRKEPK